MKLCVKESLKKGASSKELLNIPISISLLYEKEYENMMQHSNQKRRSSSEKRSAPTEKNKSTMVNHMPLRSYATEVI